MSRERRVVDDRVFLLGLDKLYRKAMWRREASELLRSSRADAKGLGSRLPFGCDPLGQALSEAAPTGWAVETLLERARQVAIETDDFSLAGLAARIQDPVILTAARESMVLHSWVALGFASLSHSRHKYVWAVDRTLARQAKRFIATVNSLFDEELPAPKPSQAESYWQAGKGNGVIGRCVRLGQDDSQAQPRHYHWAIAPGKDGQGEVEAFWDKEPWTTPRFEEKLGMRTPWPRSNRRPTSPSSRPVLKRQPGHP